MSIGRLEIKKTKMVCRNAHLVDSFFGGWFLHRLKGLLRYDCMEQSFFVGCLENSDHVFSGI